MENKPVETKEEQRFSSRKFIISIGLMILATVMLVMGFVTADIWADLIGMLSFIYIGGNVGSEAVTKWRGGKN